MSETKHTPGPWEVSLVNAFEIRASDRTHIADVYALGVGPGVERANADLIAAAPDLLAASILQEEAEDHRANCEDCEGSAGPELGCEIGFKMADDARLMRRAAIAKAGVVLEEGES